MKKKTVCDKCGQHGSLRRDLQRVQILCSNCHIQAKQAEFLSLPNPERFDFSNDGASEKYRTIGDVIEKYFVFKACHRKKGDWKNKKGDILYRKGYEYSEGSIDPDGIYKSGVKDIYKRVPDPDSGSKLLQAIYTALWEGSHLAPYCSGKVIHGDTLISAQTTINSTIEKFNKDTYCKPNGNYSINYAITIFAEFREAFSNKLKKDVPKLEKFLSIYHTLGNFMPVPVGCNKPRGSGKTKDYWDLALKIIYDYYLKKCDSIADIVGNDAKRIKNYKDWLNSFGEGAEGWQSFVRKNYLQDFVDNDGKPKELWDNHFDNWKKDDKKGALAKGEEDVTQFYDRAFEMICSRGKLMVALLKLKVQDKELYDSIRKVYFDSTDSAKAYSMEEVIEAIRNKIQDATNLDEFKEWFQKVYPQNPEKDETQDK